MEKGSRKNIRISLHLQIINNRLDYEILRYNAQIDTCIIPEKQKTSRRTNVFVAASTATPQRLIFTASLK
jgi:hypothetical protein